MRRSPVAVLSAPVVVSVLGLAAVGTIAACSMGAGAPAGARDRRDASVDAALDGRRAARPPVSAPIGHVDNAYVLASKVALPATKPGEAHGLHNVFRLSGNVISGSEPDGEAAFAQLAAMGVRTIVSVDGKTPDAATAARHGLRYVHVPIEYRGISDEELAQLVKTFRECDGPFYAHCFHGKHRGPAAAAIGRLVLDGVAREQAIAEMRQWCGTAAEYEGLYRDVATKALPTEEETRAYAFDFAPARGFTGFREAMVDVSRRDDALKRLATRDWAADPAHPDFDAVNEAGKLAATLGASRALAEVVTRPTDFQQWLERSCELSSRLSEELKAARGGDLVALEASKRTYAEISRACTDCHATYRNR